MLRLVLSAATVVGAGALLYLRQRQRAATRRLREEEKQRKQWDLINNGLVVGLDIGGTLAKIALFEPDSHSSEFVSRVVELLEDDATYGRTGKRDVHLSFYVPTLQGRFHLIR